MPCLQSFLVFFFFFPAKFYNQLVLVFVSFFYLNFLNILYCDIFQASIYANINAYFSYIWFSEQNFLNVSYVHTESL